MADHQRIFHAHRMGDAVDGSAQCNDVGPVVVTIDAHHIVARHGFFPNADGRGVVLLVIGGQEDAVVHKHRVAVGQVVSVLVGVTSALFRGTGDAHHIERGAPTCGEVAQHILQVGLDLGAIGHPRGVLCHEQGRLVQEFHVHVNVVDAVKWQVRHLDVGMDPVVVLDQPVDFFFRVVGVGRPSSKVAVVFLQDQVRGEGGAKSIRHPVASCVHQIERGIQGGVQIDPHVLGQRIGNGVVRWTVAVVDPIHQDPAVVPFCVHGIGAIVSDPNAVGGGIHHFDAVQTHAAAASPTCQVAGGLVGVF